MGVASFPVISGAQVLAGGDSTAKHEPGTIMGYRSATDQWCLAEYVQADNAGWDKGDVTVVNLATLKQYSVRAASVADEGAPMAGIALATCASQKFSWIAIQGYVETVALSHTAASGEYLMISGSTGEQLTPNKASVFNAGTHGSSSMFVVVAVAKTAIATGTGSVQICGCWGV